MINSFIVIEKLIAIPDIVLPSSVDRILKSTWVYQVGFCQGAQ
jgi:hypothetical protein